MPQDLTDNKSILVQVMAWCRQAITWASVDSVLCPHMAALGLNVLMTEFLTVFAVYKNKEKKVKFGPTIIHNYTNQKKNIYINQSPAKELILGRHETQEKQNTEESKRNASTHQKQKNKRKKIRKNKNLKIAAINVNGMKGKIRSLESLLEAEKIQIALITETKLKEKQKINIKWYK